MRARRTAVLTVALATLAPALAPPAAPAATAQKKAPRARLASFGSCDALLGYARRHGAAVTEAAGVPFRVPVPVPVPTSGPAPEANGDFVPFTGAPTSPALPDYSDTNVQESGVNEPDIVKTDGRRLFAVAGNRLYGVDLTGDAPRVAGSLELPGYGQELLLRGDRLLAISSGGVVHGGPVPVDLPVAASMLPGEYVAKTTMTEVDVSDPAHMTVRRTEAVDGSLVDARQHGAVVRVVVSAPPRAVEIGPLPPAATMPQMVAARRAAIRRTGLSTWMPRKRFASNLTGRKFNRRAAACTDVRRPVQFSGMGMLTILTIDLARGLPVRDSEAILSDARTVYASQRSLYVATERWLAPDAPPSEIAFGRSTTVHRFALDGTKTTYRASGLIGGYVLNQFALSEQDGTLRIATTSEPEWWLGDSTRIEQSSAVTTLRERDGRLEQVGRLGGLGKDERIYAVRYIGDAAFVVTFRQVDPLFAIDLSDPARPRLAGQLDLLGYSSYLHPAGDGLLLGVGQAASPQGRTEGTQLQLFDISDLAHPARIAQAKLGTFASSEAEYDHHAFLFWPKTGLAVVPVFTRDGSEAVGFDARRNGGLREVGRVSHDGGATIRRSLVVGPRLLTVSDAGVRSSTLDTLTGAGWASFG